VQNAEIVAIEGESCRLREARGRADTWARKRRGPPRFGRPLK
jgi:hypothetical protein